jgi:hypothetical protein
VQILGFGQGGFGVMSQERGDFQRNPSVDAAGPLVDRTEQVSGLGEILERQFEEQILTGLAFLEFLTDGCVIGGAILDGMIEDRRVGCQPGDREFVDVAAERAAFQQVSRDIV